MDGECSSIREKEMHMKWNSEDLKGREDNIKMDLQKIGLKL
jgi:hypothetical protein